MNYFRKCFRCGRARVVGTGVLTFYCGGGTGAGWCSGLLIELAGDELAAAQATYAIGGPAAVRLLAFPPG